MTENLNTPAGASPSTSEPPTIFCRRTAIFGAMAIASTPVAALPALASTTALSGTDVRLVALADELQTVFQEQKVLTEGDPRDCDQIPGFLAMQDRLFAIVAELYETRAESMAGVLAHARVLQVSFVAEDYESTGILAWNLADDLVRVYGGRANG